MAGSAARYPDNDQPLEDKAVLLNAVQFSTGQRAFEAELILGGLLQLEQVVDGACHRPFRLDGSKAAAQELA